MITSGHFRRESVPADRRKVILRVADETDRRSLRPRVLKQEAILQRLSCSGILGLQPEEHAKIWQS